MCSFEAESVLECFAEVDAVSDGQRLLCASDLADMGQLFLHVLTTMKHNGAVDKTQAGFTALARRQAALTA